MKRDQPVQARQANLFAIGGFVAAMCGIVLLPFLLGPIGAILGAIGWRRTKQGMGGKAFAIAAVVIGVVEILFTIFAIGVHYG
jgi:hypothetical protein